MKIAIVSLHFAEYAILLAQALSNRNHKILLLLDSDNTQAELGKPPFMPGIETIIIRRRPLKDPRSILFNAPKVISAIVKFQPDIIHVQETLPHDYLFLTLPIIKLFPAILTIHDPVPHSGQDSNIGLRKSFYQKSFRKAIQNVIVHGEKLCQVYRSTSTGRKANISVIPHGVLGKRPSTKQASIGESFLFFGRMEAYKGLGIFLDALDLLDAKKIKYKAVIAGRGSDLEQYRERIQKNAAIKLRDEFIPVEDIPSLFLGAKAVVLPYLDGTQSGVTSMAFGFGRPVIASNVGSLPEMVQDGKTGLLIPSKNATALAIAIEKLIGDQPFLSRLEENVKNAAEHEFSWSAIAVQTEFAYLGAINANKE